MNLFGRIFPHENAGGPVKRGDFMINEMIKGIDKIREYEKHAQTSPPPGIIGSRDGGRAVKNWELVFEEQLIPLVSRARNANDLESCLAVLIETLFGRAGDEANKENFRQKMESHIRKATDFASRQRGAIEFLRVIKKLRITLAAEALRKQQEGLKRGDDDGQHMVPAGV
jgi:hypothetical protein